MVSLTSFTSFHWVFMVIQKAASKDIKIQRVIQLYLSLSLILSCHGCYIVGPVVPQRSSLFANIWTCYHDEIQFKIWCCPSLSAWHGILEHHQYVMLAKHAK